MGDYLRRKIAAHSRQLVVAKLARERLQLLRAGDDYQDTESIMDFIPRVSPRWESPRHLTPYVDELERAPGSDLRIVIAAPPQHAKTETTIHATVKWLQRFPHMSFAYATYSQERADRVAKRTRAIADSAGLNLAAGSTTRLWLLEGGGQIRWTSVEGALTGDPISGVLIIDDPIKGRKEAESPTIRANFKDWYHGTAEARLHPGASVICMATRWHTDDPSGYLIRENGFRYINLKAIADEDRPANDNREPGEALWESHRPLEMLEQRRAGNVWNFASLYQGEPRPRGGAVFGEPHYYDPHELPSSGYRIAFGVDLAYSSKTTADFSVCVELRATPDGKIYVARRHKAQVEAPAFCLTLKAARVDHPHARFFWYAAGTEKGAADFIKAKGIPLTVIDPKGRDKFQRAQHTAELWNSGRILVPASDEPWVDDFVAELCNFTGVKDPHDDQVDALVPAVDALSRGKQSTDLIRVPSRRR